MLDGTDYRYYHHVAARVPRKSQKLYTGIKKRHAMDSSAWFLCGTCVAIAWWCIPPSILRDVVALWAPQKPPARRPVMRKCPQL